MRPGWLRSKGQVLAVGAVVLCAVGLTYHFAWGPALALDAWSRSNPFRDYREVRFEGKIEVISAGWWVISGHRLRVAADLATSGFRVGDWVTVHAERQRDGGLEAVALKELGAAGQDAEMVLARAQSVLSASSDAALVEFEGRVQQLPSDGLVGEWLVDEVRVIVGESTKVLGVPSLGTDVEVSGTSEGERLLRAKDITVVVPEYDPLLVYGLITDSTMGVESSVLTLSIRDEKGIELPVSVRVDEHTFFDESHGRADEDMWAELRVVPQEDGSLWAQYVKVVRP